MKDRKGFTLIELLLVVAILAFLVAIIVVAAGQVSLSSKKRSMYASLKSIKVGVENYYIHYNEFPADNTTWETELMLWSQTRPRAIDAIPVDIFHATPNTKVEYACDATGKPTYVAWSVGPDGTKDITGADDDDLIPNAYDPSAAGNDDVFVTNAKGKHYSE